MEKWIKEKLKIALDGSYLRLNSIRARLETQKSLRTELKTQSNNLKHLNVAGDFLIANGNSEALDVRRRLQTINNMWNRVVVALKKNGGRLAGARDEAQYYRNIEELEFWVEEIEHWLGSEDIGKDLESSQDLQRNLAQIENDYLILCELVDGVKDSNPLFGDEIGLNLTHLRENWVYLRVNAEKRLLNLEFFLRARKYTDGVNEAEEWLAEMEPAVGLVDYGEDEETTEALRKKFRTIMSSLNAFKVEIDYLRREAEDCKDQKQDVGQLC
ncbi:spectrin repeat-containing domain protein [Necator americanus]|uniref:Spectrin repeat-containing domain protein n=1 Tax=Necator americanus TaxID=51031 RepID=W2SZJ5_NECAM|nr:spectrin repeat-containing domain protein [Necator americanus]ETN75170.1 spectrin repeat-containing domain protein [Necator americanus]